MSSFLLAIPRCSASSAAAASFLLASSSPSSVSSFQTLARPLSTAAKSLSLHSYQHKQHQQHQQQRHYHGALPFTKKRPLLPLSVMTPGDADLSLPPLLLPSAITIQAAIGLPDQKRFFSRRTSASPRTRTTVLERDRPQEEDRRASDPYASPYAPQEQQQQPPAAAESDAAQYESLTPGAVQHLRKVYGTLGATTGIAAAGALLGMAVPVSPLITGLGAVVPLMAIYFTDHKTSSPTLRMGFLTAFGLLSGMSIGPLLGAVAAVNPLSIPVALGLTTGIFGTMTALSFFAKKRSFLSLGAPLLGGTLVLLAAGLGSMFVPVASAWYPVLHNVSLYGGLALFSVFIAYDTQSILADYEAGEKDAIRHAVNMFINLKGIFVRLLSILNRND